MLAEVIEDLLASASMTSGRTPRDRIDIAAIGRAVAESMDQHCQTAGVRLVVDTGADHRSPDGSVVLGSAAALRRAVMSLIDNALAHEHPGGTITLAVARTGGEVVLEVRDDGVGVEPSALHTLFDRFAHGHGHTVTGGRARHGIGLALVREIAHAHGGRIDVAQTPGGGATFTLTIPAAV